MEVFINDVPNSLWYFTMPLWTKSLYLDAAMIVSWLFCTVFDSNQTIFRDRLSSEQNVSETK